MQAEINRNLLSFAVGRQIFCRRCRVRHTLNAPDAVLATLKTPDGEHEYLMCCRHYDRIKLVMADTATQSGWTLEILDGRLLFPQTRKARKRPVAAPRSPQEAHDRVYAALVAYDRRQRILASRNPRRSWNCYALALYLQALDRADAAVYAGAEIGPALREQFCGPVLAAVLRSIGEVK